MNMEIKITNRFCQLYLKQNHIMHQFGPCLAANILHIFLLLLFMLQLVRGGLQFGYLP